MKLDAGKRKEFERLEKDTAESPDDVSATWAESQLDQLFGASKSREQKTGDGARFVNNKRRIRTKPICNLKMSEARMPKLAPPIPVNDGVTQPKARTGNGPWCNLSNSLAAPEEIRKIIDIYRVEFPQDEFPDHELFPRAPRNKSPTRQKDEAVLKSLMAYFDLHYRSIEALQTNWGERDAQRPFSDEDDYSPRPLNGDPDAELEIRPSCEELMIRLDAAGLSYSTRWVRNGPVFRNVGYISQFRYGMIVPVSGDVQLIDYNGEATRVVRLDEADQHLPIYRLGTLEFATEKHKTRKSPRLGQLLRYSGFRVKDAYGTPKGPKIRGSDPKWWNPLYPRSSFLGHLPDDVESYDELQFGYCWGSHSEAPNDAQPFDDVVQRKLDRIRLRKRLSPNERRVLDMLVWTDNTDTLAESFADIGAAVLSRPASWRTRHRYGQAAVRWVSRAVANALMSVSGRSQRISIGNDRRWSSISAMQDWRRPKLHGSLRPQCWQIFRPDHTWRLKCCNFATDKSILRAPVSL